MVLIVEILVIWVLVALLPDDISLIDVGENFADLARELSDEKRKNEDS